MKSLFKDVGDEVNGVFLVNFIAWIAVAVGGDSAWKEYRRENKPAKKPVLENSRSCKP